MPVKPDSRSGLSSPPACHPVGNVVQSSARGPWNDYRVLSTARIVTNHISRLSSYALWSEGMEIMVDRKRVTTSVEAIRKNGPV